MAAKQPPQDYWGNPPEITPPSEQSAGAIPQNQQQPNQTPPPQQDLPEKRHVHHSYVWLGTIRVGITVLFTIIIIVFATVIGEVMEGSIQSATELTTGIVPLIIGGVTIGALVLVMGLVAVLQVFSYRHLFYELGPEEFNLYSGVFSKKRVHVPYQRIQSVNQRASLIQRLAGVCTLNIDTAGGASNKAVVVPYVQNFEAERLRREIFARKQAILSGQPLTNQQVQAAGSAAQVAGASQKNVLDSSAEFMDDVRGVFGGASIDTGEVTYEYGMSNKELVLTGLSNSMGFVFVVLAAVAAIATAVVQILETAVGRALAEEGLTWATQTFADNLIGFIVGSVLSLMLVIWVLSIIGTCISYGGFHARRRQTRIEVEHGLLQHQFHGVDIDRVQSVIIKQGFVRRFFGYCELSLGKIDALTGSESDGQQAANATKGLVIHPFVKMSRVPDLLAGLVPEFADVPTETIKLPKVSLRRALIRRCILHGSGFWLAVCAAILQIIINVSIGSEGVYESMYETIVFAPELFVLNAIFLVIYAVCLVALIFEIVGSFLWHRASGFAYNDKFMQIKNGGYAIESISFPRKKIQFGTVKTNPLQRRAKVTTITARTAAGIGGTSVRLLDVAEQDADTWFTWLEPRRKN